MTDSKRETMANAEVNQEEKEAAVKADKTTTVQNIAQNNESLQDADVQQNEASEAANGQVPVYVPRERGDVRCAVDVSVIDERIAETEMAFAKHVDEIDYRNLDFYIARANLRFAAGDDPVLVIDDLFLAARCLHDKHLMHLELKPPEMFFTRRILPVELGFISGTPMLTLEFAAVYGLPLMMVMADAAPADTMSEAYLLTSYFRRKFCADFYELAGLAAVTYAGALASIARGFDDEAVLALSHYAKARESLRGKPPAGVLLKIERYDALCTALACVCNGDADGLTTVLQTIANNFNLQQHKRFPEQAYSAPKSLDKMPKYLDTAIVSLLAAMALREIIIDVPNTGELAPYRAIIEAFTDIPERRIEVPELDAEARAILAQHGVDPDALQSPYIESSTQQILEAKEARALEILQQRQQRAQQAVVERIKMAEEAGEPLQTDINPELAQEAAKKSELYKHFFDGSDDDHDPNALFEEEMMPEVSEVKKIDVSTFFQQDEHAQADEKSTQNEELQANTEELVPKDFTHFFDGIDETIPAFERDDDEHKKEETLSVEPRVFGADFFEHDDEKKITDLQMEPERNDEKEELKSGDVDQNTGKAMMPKEDLPRHSPGFDTDTPVVVKKTSYSDFFDEQKPRQSTSGLQMDIVAEPTTESVEEQKRRQNRQKWRQKIEAEREAQVREIQELARQKQEREQQNLRLEASVEDEDEIIAPSLSRREKAQKLIDERQQAVREAAVAQRKAEEEERAKLPTPQVKTEMLKLTPDPDTDPDAPTEVVQPEDLAISPYAYTALDQIHDNTQLIETAEEDITVQNIIDHDEMPSSLDKHSDCTHDTEGQSEGSSSTIVHDDEVHFEIDYDGSEE